MASIACIIPVYNAGALLQRAVDSVLAQGEDVQLVLVDDCSTDDSAARVRKLAEAEPRILPVCLSRNRGQSNARNIGVAAADAPVVTFLDQDDEHLGGWYYHALDELDAHGALAAVRGAVEWVDAASGTVLVPPEDPRSEAMLNSVMWNVVVRKPVYQAVGGCPVSPAFRTRQGVEDVAFLMALRRHFSLAQMDFVSSRHYIKPQGAAAYFLERTRLSGGTFVFAEQTAAEADGGLGAALQDHLDLADANLRALREGAARAG